MTIEETTTETPQAPQGVTAEEFAELKTAVGGLTSALEELRQARTEPEKTEARDGVREAKADLKTLASELGIDPKRLEQAAENARREQRKEELRPLLVELLDEELAEEVEETIEELTGEGEQKPKPEPKPKEDSGPSAEHWSEGPIGGLLGLGGRK